MASATGYSPVGAGLQSLSDLLLQFLSQRMGMQQRTRERAEDRADRQKQFDEEMALRKADMAQRQSEFAQTMASNKEGREESVALAQAPNLPSDTALSGLDPNVQKILQKYGVLQTKDTLPSKQLSDTGVTDSQSQSMVFRPATPGESTQRELLQMEKDRAGREAATSAEALRTSKLNTMSDTQKMKLDFEQRMKELQAQLASSQKIASEPRRTSPFDSAMAFLDWWKTQKPDPDKGATPQQMAQWQTMGKTFINLMQNAGVKFPNLDLPTGDEPKKVTDAPIPPGMQPQPPSGPGFMSSIRNFLSAPASQEFSIPNPFGFANKCPDGSFPVDGKCR